MIRGRESASSRVVRSSSATWSASWPGQRGVAERDRGLVGQRLEEAARRRAAGRGRGERHRDAARARVPSVRTGTHVPRPASSASVAHQPQVRGHRLAAGDVQGGLRPAADTARAGRLGDGRQQVVGVRRLGQAAAEVRSAS